MQVVLYKKKILRIFFFFRCIQVECLANPCKPQYGGRIIINPEFNHGQKGWTTFGNERGNKESQKVATNSLWLVVGINHMIVSHRSFICIGTSSTLNQWYDRVSISFELINYILFSKLNPVVK